MDDILLNTGPTMPTIDYENILDDNENIHFNGESFLEMNTLKASIKVFIKLEIIPFTLDGIIMYNGQTSTGEGDYIAIIIKNGFIELRFNLGSGSAVIKSSKPAILGQSIQITINRHFSEASLSIDNDEPIMGKSDGPHKILDLRQNLYIGGLPFHNFKKIDNILETKKNFTGCLHFLMINSDKINLNPTASNMSWTNIGKYG